MATTTVTPEGHLIMDPNTDVPDAKTKLPDIINIVTVSNGWMVFTRRSGECDMDFHRGEIVRPQFVFTDLDELNLAIRSLLLTGTYSKE